MVSLKFTEGRPRMGDPLQNKVVFPSRYESNAVSYLDGSAVSFLGRFAAGLTFSLSAS